jgi:hypothetical protein
MSHVVADRRTPAGQAESAAPNGREGIVLAPGWFILPAAVAGGAIWVALFRAAASWLG